MSQYYLYTLVFDAEPEPVVFYVGHTNNLQRREAEHRSSAKNTLNSEYKYRWIRELELLAIDWHMVPICEIATDEDTEYEWLLKFARYNQSKNITFFDDLPLCNMRAGDFLHEILHRTDIQTASDIRQYKRQSAEAKKAAEVNYNRTATVDYFNPTPRPLTERAVVLADYLNELGAAERESAERERAKRLKRAEQYEQMLKDPTRIAKIQAETQRLLDEDDK